jgi:hypothetical protein
MTKFSKRQLAQIIKEEYEVALNEISTADFRQAQKDISSTAVNPPAGQVVPDRIAVGPATPPGDPNFMAIRQLSIMARDASLSFEANIIKQLGLRDPNGMDAESQKYYNDVMESMQLGIMSLVVDAIQKVSELPKEEKEV